MPEAYSVAAELTLKSNIPAVMREMIDALERGRRAVTDLQAEFDALGKAGRGISSLVRSLTRLQDVRFPSSLVTGAQGLEDKLSGAVDQMDRLVRGAREVGASLGGARVPGGGGGGGGRGHGGHGGGDPLIEGIAGGGLLEWYSTNFEMAAKVEQTYRGFQSDSRLAGNSPAYAAMRAQAAGQLLKYRTLTPIDVAKNAGEAFSIGGGDMREQSAIADMLDRAEQNLIARNPNLDAGDAQRQAVAMLKGLDVSNRFLDPKTGQFSTGRANTELDRVQALLAASNGLATGQNFYAFEKSAKLAGQRLSLEGEAEMAHYIEINPSRAGTALSSFENLFGGHASRMAKKDKRYWTKQGVFGQDGRVVDSGLFYSNPIEWISKHFSHINLDDISDRTQRQTVGSLIGETLGATGNINRQAASTARQNVTGNTSNLLSGPGGKLLIFDASLDRFRVSLGAFENGPGSKILDMLSTGLDRLTKTMTDHPGAAKGFLELTAALGAFAVIRGAFVLSGLGGSLRLLGGSLGPFGAGGTAMTALTRLAGPAGLIGLGLGLDTLARSLTSLPHWLIDLATGAATGAVVGGPVGAVVGGAVGVAGGAIADGGMHGTAPPGMHWQSFGRGIGGWVPNAPSVQHESYVPSGGGMRPMQITLMVDGKTLGQVVTAQQVRSIGAAHQTGQSGPDYQAIPLPVAMSPSLI